MAWEDWEELGDDGDIMEDEQLSGDEEDSLFLDEEVSKEDGEIPEFDSFMNDTINEDSATEELKDKKNKKAIYITLAIGVTAVVVAILVQSKLTRGNDSESSVSSGSIVEEEDNSNTDATTDEYEEGINNNANVVDTELEESWVEIGDSEKVEFNEEYTEAIFTITEISNVAKNDSGTIQIKSILKGSLSGLSGTYEIEVPYEKGINLSVGNSFEVSILLGTYEKNTVLGDIKY